MLTGLHISIAACALIIGFLICCLVIQPQDVRFASLNIFRHGRRSLSTIATIVIGGCALFLYGGFINYSYTVLEEQTVRTNLGHVQIYDSHYFTTSNKSKSIIVDYPSLKEKILKNGELAPYIDTLSGQIEFSGVISQYENATSSFFSALGTEPLASLKLGAFDNLISGSDLSRVKHNEITLGSGLAATLNAHYGDWLDALTVNISGGQGAMSLKVRGIFSAGIKDYDDVALRMPLETAQRLMATDGVSKIVILLKNGSDVPVFCEKLQRFIKQERRPLIVKDWKTLSLFYHQVEGLLSGINFFIKIIVALIVTFMIGNTLTMNIAERTREIATLRALGLKPAHITRLFLLEGIFIGLAGALISLALGMAIAGLININGIAMPPSPGQTRGYTAFIQTGSPALIWITLALPVITASLASIIPAIRAAKLSISDAFKFV
jgi:putative ABC transport system permease protein